MKQAPYVNVILEGNTAIEVDGVVTMRVGCLYRIQNASATVVARANYIGFMSETHVCDAAKVCGRDYPCHMGEEGNLTLELKLLPSSQVSRRKGSSEGGRTKTHIRHERSSPQASLYHAAIHQNPTIFLEIPSVGGQQAMETNAEGAYREHGQKCEGVF